MEGSRVFYARSPQLIVEWERVKNTGRVEMIKLTRERQRKV